MFKVRVVRIDKDLPLPEYQTSGAVALDLYSRTTETIGPHELKVLPSNLIIEVPEGFFLMVASRSGTPRKKSLQTPHGVGIIDQDYHGPKDEIGILVYNFSEVPVTVERGERIAQALFLPIAKVELQEVGEIKNESRGGFGTTG